MILFDRKFFGFSGQDLVRICQRPRASAKRAFTLIELLVVIAIIAILAAMLLPALAKSKQKARRVQCMNNIRQFQLVLVMYASDYRDLLPHAPGVATWEAWDIPTAAIDAMLASGANQKIFFCPGISPPWSDQHLFGNNGVGGLWNFGAYRVIGYAMAFQQTQLIQSNRNTRLSAEVIKVDATTQLPPPPNTDRVLLADATVSEKSADNQASLQGGARYNFTNIKLGYHTANPTAPGHLSPHLERGIPSGGSVGFKDGHVEWRKFRDMDRRGQGGIGWWW